MNATNLNGNKMGREDFLALSRRIRAITIGYTSVIKHSVVTRRSLDSFEVGTIGWKEQTDTEAINQIWKESKDVDL